MKDLSEIIVYYKGQERLTRCLESLHVIEDERFSLEVIVVDNQSQDGSRERLISLFPRFTFVANTGNNGFANGCNYGAAKSNGSFLLFLNTDTTVRTKAEVHKSRHVCISRHEKGTRAFFMHFVLITDNLLLGFVPALAGMVLFFSGRLSVVPLIYANQAKYYTKVLFRGTWLSERSVNFKKDTTG